MSFQPSTYSESNYSGSDTFTLTDSQVATMAATQEKIGKWSSIIDAAGAITAGTISTISGLKSQKSSQAHQTVMAEKQAELYALQAQVAGAQGASNRAAASLQGLATTKTLLIVGGAILSLGIIAATAVALRRPAYSDDDDYDDDYEEYE